jgi:ankyrin repeat protein
LHEAAWEGRKEVVELLIAKGADVNAKDWEGNTPLDMVMMSGEPEIADILREHGGKTSDWFSDWNKAEESIHIAVRVGHIEAVKQHLAAGTDVNAKDGEWGYTLLHSAVDKGHKEVAELLIANGADVNAKWGEWDQWTPLHFATTKGIAELLIAKGADVNAKSFRGYTPLHQAASGGIWRSQGNRRTADCRRCGFKCEGRFYGIYSFAFCG